MEKDLKSATFLGLFWKFLERFGAQGVTFVVSIIIARILDPDAYGTVAIVTVFINILEIFISSGMGNALIQKKDADDLDFSTLFHFNIVVCVLLYILIFVSAPFIAVFYAIPDLTALIRVLGLTLIVSGIKNIQSSYVSRNMLFKRFFFATLGGTIGAAALGIWMAYRGYGVWALIAQSLFNNTVDTIILWLTVKWRPKRQFSFQRLKSLFSYGWKLLVAELLSTLHGEICQLIIGKVYSKEDLAFYNKAQTLPYTVVSNINFSVNSVLFPTMSAIQDQKSELKAVMRRTTTICSYIMWPMMTGIAVCAVPLVRLLLTEKWLPCVPFIIIYCLKYVLYPINLSNLNAIKSIGRSDLILKQEVFKKVFGLIILAATMWNGVFVFALGQLLTDIVSLVINTSSSKKLFDYGVFEQIKDITSTIILSCVMGGIVYSVTLLNLNDILTLAIQTLLGIAVYIIGSVIFRFDCFNYIWNIVKGFLSKIKTKQGVHNEL